MLCDPPKFHSWPTSVSRPMVWETSGLYHKDNFKTILFYFNFFINKICFFRIKYININDYTCRKNVIEIMFCFIYVNFLMVLCNTTKELFYNITIIK